MQTNSFLQYTYSCEVEECNSTTEKLLPITDPMKENCHCVLVQFNWIRVSIRAYLLFAVYNGISGY